MGQEEIMRLLSLMGTIVVVVMGVLTVGMSQSAPADQIAAVQDTAGGFSVDKTPVTCNCSVADQVNPIVYPGL
jgi:hypothetical protein